MRWFINYIRSCFCKHDWELLDVSEVCGESDKYPKRRQWLYRCKKCGNKNKVTTD